jgi:hypothetical protein
MTDTNNFYFHPDTKEEVKQVIKRAYNTGIRLRIYYGDDSGKDWQCENDVLGYIGKSCGEQKVPLLVFNKRCYGGDAILTHCIVKVATSKGKYVLYQHPKYHNPKLRIVPINETSEENQKCCNGEYSFSVLVEDNSVSANFQTLAQAEKYVQHLS